MTTIFVFLAEGFEEIEAITPIDIWRRAGYDVKTISITTNKAVTGAHQITVYSDYLYGEADYNQGDMIFLPGGMPGTLNLDAHAELKELITEFSTKGKYIAAICAAPIVLGHAKLLLGKKATCYPGYEKELIGSEVTSRNFECDGNIITGKGAGVALEFALRVVELLSGKEAAMNLSNKIQKTTS
jgi:protein deglycase